MPATKSKGAYQVGWIAALHIERAAAITLLDERHEQPLDFVKSPGDDNSYTFGRIHDHNVVIASLPDGAYGQTSATKTAAGLISTFPHIRIGLLVGIGAGVPESESGEDIQLGDVVVGRPEGTAGGVIQYDTGKAKASGWERTGVLCSPPSALLAALATLRSEHELVDEPPMNSILKEVLDKTTKFARNYKYPGPLDHSNDEDGADQLPAGMVLPKSTRMANSPCIHYGTIASGNMVVKTAAARREIVQRIGQRCLCIEMEAAGLLNSFPCLVVRGICDFGDERKNDDWQRYASLTAAAYAKELLMYLQQSQVSTEDSIGSLLQNVQNGINILNQNADRQRQEQYAEKVARFLQALYDRPYTEIKDRNASSLKGTCQWFTRHDTFKKWHQANKARLLWVSADPGCGKSVLARHLIDEVLPQPDTTICYFFFKDDFIDQKASAAAIACLLRQLFDSEPDLINQDLIKKFEKDGLQFLRSFSYVWGIFLATCIRAAAKSIVCVFDALDECQVCDSEPLIRSLRQCADNTNYNKVKILTTSRRYHLINKSMSDLSTGLPIIHLDGDDQTEKNEISKEIDIVIIHRINVFLLDKEIASSDREFLIKKFTSVPQRTYLWAHLTLSELEKCPGFTRAQVQTLCAHLPSSVEDAYERILSRSTNISRAQLLLQIVIAANRPLSLTEMSVLLAISSGSLYSHEIDNVEGLDTFASTIKNLCGLFVSIVDSTIYLIHQTAREFLIQNTDQSYQHQPTDTQRETPPSGLITWKQSISLARAHRTMAEGCVRLELLPPPQYVLLENFFSKYLPKNSSLEGKCLEELRDYCGTNWRHHCAESDFTSTDSWWLQVLEICDPTKTAFKHPHLWHIPIESILKLDFVGSWHSIDQALEQFVKRASPLYLPAFLGLSVLVQHQLNVKKFNAGERRDSFRWNISRKNLSEALYWFCAGLGRQDAGHLLSEGANPNVYIAQRSITFRWRRLRPQWGVTRNRPIRFIRPLGTMDEIRVDLPEDRPISCLQHAALKGDFQLVEQLLEHNAQPGHTTKQNRTALHFAAWNCDAELLRLLVNKGCDVKIRGRYSGTALFELVASEHETGDCKGCHEILWTKLTMSEVREVFIIAISRHCEECFRFLCYKMKALQMPWKDYGGGLMTQAVRGNSVYMVQAFLTLGATLRDSDYFNTDKGSSRHSLLSLAVGTYSQSGAVTRFLLDSGADQSVKHFTGKRQFTYVSKDSTEDGVASTSGGTLMHYVTNDEALKVLCDTGFDINSRDDTGKTPLIVFLLNYSSFIERGRLQGLVDAFLDHGADPRIEDNGGHTASWYADRMFMISEYIRTTLENWRPTPHENT